MFLLPKDEEAIDARNVDAGMNLEERDKMSDLRHYEDETVAEARSAHTGNKSEESDRMSMLRQPETPVSVFPFLRRRSQRDVQQSLYCKSFLHWFPFGL